jgi:hypothetical protein
VRVPFDFDGDTLELTAFTYTQGGSWLEIVTTEVAVLDPAWIAVAPSVLPIGTETQTVDLSSQGVDITALDALSLNGEGSVSLAAWEATSPDSGSLTIVVADGAIAGAYELIADDGDREIIGLLAYGSPSAGVSAADTGLLAGDQGFVPLVSTGMLLVEDTVEITGDGSVAVVDWTFIDSRCVVVEIETLESATVGTHALTVSNGTDDLQAHLYVHEPIL